MLEENKALARRVLEDLVVKMDLEKIDEYFAADVIVHVPADDLVFTGDILFVEGHPIIWAGPVQNWIDACEYMLSLPGQVVSSQSGSDERGAWKAPRHQVGIPRRRESSSPDTSENALLGGQRSGRLHRHRATRSR